MRLEFRKDVEAICGSDEPQPKRAQLETDNDGSQRHLEGIGSTTMARRLLAYVAEKACCSRPLEEKIAFHGLV
jgi:hypothetical protein